MSFLTYAIKFTPKGIEAARLLYKQIDDHKGNIKDVFDKMDNDELEAIFVPDVFQKDIYSIDYDKLKDAGIEFIVFCLNYTIAGKEKSSPSDRAVKLFSELKGKGFKLYVRCRNTNRAKKFARELGIPGNYIAADAGIDTFRYILNENNIDGNKMIYIGYRQIKDIGSSSFAGIYNCLVRKKGGNKIPQKIPDVGRNALIGDKGHELRKVLKEREIWHRYYTAVKGDQYYQLGETQRF
ncbi:MAG: hypothetical protein NC253_01770 [Ruminococcus sp.]|nr:hypothetical protein [Ruminococcus sp.]MCM1381207.1 hypothetical protein [Muribaculaceae bacterium]MCM1478723.1 hypothetical protein [Muribaculaceae bacterium]